MDCLPVFGITFPVKTTQAVTIFEIIKNCFFRNPKTVRYGTETVSCIVPKIWSKVPKTIKMSSPLESLNQKYQNGNHNATAAFARNICTMLVSLMLFSFYLLWFR